MNVKTVNIDRYALKTYFSEHKIYATKLATEMGLAQNYFSECIREKNPKKMPYTTYKYLCTMLKVDEGTFLVKDKPKEEPKKEVQVVAQPSITPGQFNSLLQALQSLTDAVNNINKGLDKIASTESSNAVIQGKIYGCVTELTNALGVPTPKPQTDAKGITVKPQYAKPQYTQIGGNK